MQRYLAIEQSIKPFITWVGTNLPLGALVVNESDVPANVFGVCPLKIVDGELVARTSGEMAVFEAEFIAKTAVQTFANKADEINAAVFSYGANNYPMHEAARLRYYALLEQGTASFNCINSEGVAVALTDTDIPLMISEMNKSIITITS